MNHTDNFPFVLVPAGGLFATLQSAGAAGLGWLSSLGIGSTVTVICTALP